MLQLAESSVQGYLSDKPRIGQATGFRDNVLTKKTKKQKTKTHKKTKKKNNKKKKKNT